MRRVTLQVIFSREFLEDVKIGDKQVTVLHHSHHEQCTMLVYLLRVSRNRHRHT